MRAEELCERSIARRTHLPRWHVDGVMAHDPAAHSRLQLAATVAAYFSLN